MVVGDAEGVPRYVLVSAVKTKVLQKRLRAFTVNKVQVAVPAVSEDEEPLVQDAAKPRASRSKATPKQKAKLPKSKASPVKSPVAELPQRDSSKEAKQFLEMSALLNTMEAKRKLEKAKSKGSYRPATRFRASASEVSDNADGTAADEGPASTRAKQKSKPRAAPVPEDDFDLGEDDDAVEAEIIVLEASAARKHGTYSRKWP